MNIDFKDPQILKAFQIAATAHSGQFDKAGVPYIMHPIRVMSHFDNDPCKQMIALLHDVIEDTDWTPKDLLDNKIPEPVVDAVVALTYFWDESDSDYYQRIRENLNALAVKLADINDNSDPKRLAELDEKVRDRLVEKYRQARISLGACS